MTVDLLLGALSWDPQIRGFEIVLVSFLILPGSVYLLLATNTGARIGFVLAAAGLFGWMAVMGAVWMVFGIGYKGPDPHWKVEEVVTASQPVSELTTVEAARDLPEGDWERLQTGNPILGDAQAAADKVLAPSSADEGWHGGGGGGETEESFDSPFSQPTDYVQVAGYRKGGERYGLFGMDFRPFNVFHKPHYAVVQVQPALRQTGPEPFGPGGAPGQAAADTTQQTTTVVMVRDLGARRFPPFVIAVTSGLIFAVLCYWLHQRDREILRLRQLEPAAA